MHTSMATAMTIVAWKEKDTWFRWSWIGYCSLVVFSTVYFPVHWVLDLVGGVILGTVSALVGGKLAEKVTGHITVFFSAVKIKKRPRFCVVLKKKEND